MGNVIKAYDVILGSKTKMEIRVYNMEVLYEAWILPLSYDDSNLMRHFNKDRCRRIQGKTIELAVTGAEQWIKSKFGQAVSVSEKRLTLPEDESKQEVKKRED